MQNNKSYGIINDEYNINKKKENFAPARSGQRKVWSQQSSNESRSIVDDGYGIKNQRKDLPKSNQPKTWSVPDITRNDDFAKPPNHQFPVNSWGEKDVYKPKRWGTPEANEKIANITEANRKQVPDTNGEVNLKMAEVLPAINKVYDGMQEKAEKRKWDMSVEHVKKIQTFLNDFGYTDRVGKPLNVDGLLGPKTKIALEKHLQENSPKQEVLDLQTLLNKNGFKDKDGKPLKPDGILGEKTDSAVNRAVTKLEKPENSIVISDQHQVPYSPLNLEEDKTKNLIEGSKLNNVEITPDLEKYSFSVTAATIAATTAIGTGVVDGLITGGVYAFTGKRFGAGFINGFVEGLSTTVGTYIGGIPGTVIGGTLGSALGSLSEDLLFNRDNKSAEDIASSAAKEAAYGIMSGVGSAYWKYAIKLANEAESAAQILMKYDEEFGKTLEIFFEQLVNILSSQ